MYFPSFLWMNKVIIIYVIYIILVVVEKQGVWLVTIYY